MGKDNDGEPGSMKGRAMQITCYLKWRVILFAVLYGGTVAFVVYAMAGYFGAGAVYADPTPPIILFNCH